MPELTNTEADIAAALVSQAVVEKAIEAAKPPEKTCELKDVLMPNIIELLKTFPTNPTVRTMIGAKLGFPVPDDKVKYEDIVEWIEHHPKLKCEPVPEVPKYVYITIHNNGTEEGTAIYSVRTRGNQEFALDEKKLMELVASAEGWSDFSALLNTYISENESIHMEHYGEPSYDVHEPSDSEDDGWDYVSWARAKAELIDRIKQLNPAEAQRIGI